MPEYEVLRFIWWLLLGILLIGFAITDGFDLGVAAIFRFVGRSNEERMALLESVEPVWEGNQVWLVLGAGAAFAAWPMLYAAAFSSFYLAMLLLLAVLIIRPVGIHLQGQDRRPALAPCMGLGAVHQWICFRTAVWSRVWQSVHRRTLSPRRALAPGLQRRVFLALASFRLAVGSHQPRDAHHARCKLRGLEGRVSHGQSGSSRWANRSAGPDRCILTRGTVARERHRWLADHERDRRKRTQQPVTQDRAAPPRAPGSTTSGVIRLCGLLP